MRITCPYCGERALEEFTYRGDATVKRFYRKRGRIHLVPANERLEPIVARDDEVEIRGVVVGLVRRYRR